MATFHYEWHPPPPLRDKIARRWQGWQEFVRQAPRTPADLHSCIRRALCPELPDDMAPTEPSPLQLWRDTFGDSVSRWPGWMKSLAALGTASPQDATLASRVESALLFIASLLPLYLVGAAIAVSSSGASWLKAGGVLGIEVLKEVGEWLLSLRTQQGRAGALAWGIRVSAFAVRLVIYFLTAQICLHSYASTRFAKDLGVRWQCVCTSTGRLVLVVDEVESNKPLHAAGCQPGDIILMGQDRLIHEARHGSCNWVVPVSRGGEEAE